MRFRRLAKNLAMPLVAALAILYFLIDGLFLSLLRPVARAIGRLTVMARLGERVRALPPYPALILVVIPVALLEPAKPLGFYLMAAGHFRTGIGIIAGAEILKVLVVERLFDMSRDKIMSIWWFARGYNFVIGWLVRLRILQAWRAARRWGLQLRQALRRLAGWLAREMRREPG